MRELSEHFTEVKIIFERASLVLKYDLWDLTQNGPAEKLDQTIFTQPALLAADVAVWICFQKLTQLKPCMIAGHSLGEYAALVAAEVLQFEDAIQLVSNRGKFMQEAISEDVGAMAAIVGLDDTAVLNICNNASTEGIVSPANYNSIGQVVISGEKKAVLKAIQLAEENGARMAKCIPVSVPSHCVLMQSAADRLEIELKKINMAAPTIPVVQNFDVQFHTDPKNILTSLTQQLTQPVRWVETIQRMISKHIHLFLECGPGRVLAGLNKRISKDIETENMQTTEALEKVCALLRGVSCHH
ncbi:MAG: Acyl carrier protein S-malonyltransferase [uncultured bacterium]|nr:MAG: Acyl carrier protein S-malonyltransferase [uncultured bacterium]